MNFVQQHLADVDDRQSSSELRAIQDSAGGVDKARLVAAHAGGEAFRGAAGAALAPVQLASDVALSGGKFLQDAGRDLTPMDYVKAMTPVGSLSEGQYVRTLMSQYPTFSSRGEQGGDPFHDMLNLTDLGLPAWNV